MPYTYGTERDEQEMLEAIGIDGVEDLLRQVPAEMRLTRPLDLPPAMGELELTQHLQSLSQQNTSAQQAVCFLGGGSYDHFIPAVVDALASRGEFYTSYTPYQPEVSQGNLQVMFEYQTLICQLTGLDVSNASLYDGGSSVAEAALMSLSITRRHGKVIVPSTVHPEYRRILETYLASTDTELVTVAATNGRVAPADIAAVIDEGTASVILQHPNFFGCLEQVEEIAEIAHANGSLLVMAFDPISLGRLKSPGELGADIAVAEGQCLGSPMAFGGPYLGIMACKEEFVRRMPGRIAGETVDRRGQRCWVLTLQTREQHIRREKATSNICTNQGLFALRASIYLSVLGPHGLREVADLCLQKSHFAAELISQSSRCELAWSDPFFKEFVVRDTRGQVDELLAEARHDGLLAGVALGRWYPDLEDCFLVSVTEQRTREELERLGSCLSANNNQEVCHA
jgi:glycine dehydrogenase subunit 1